MNCRHCGHPLHTYTQPSISPKRPPMTLVECHNRACPLYMQTLTRDDYPTVDLSKYIKKR